MRVEHALIGALVLTWLFGVYVIYDRRHHHSSPPVPISIAETLRELKPLTPAQKWRRMVLLAGADDIQAFFKTKGCLTRNVRLVFSPEMSNVYKYDFITIFEGAHLQPFDGGTTNGIESGFTLYSAPNDSSVDVMRDHLRRAFPTIPITLRQTKLSGRHIENGEMIDVRYILHVGRP